VLEANLVLHNGMSLPIINKFLFYEQHQELDTHKKEHKQDCELKSFRRLAKRLKAQFLIFKIMVLLDGLYANGPVMALCKAYRWQYMIVLKDDCLTTVWREFEQLKIIQKEKTTTTTLHGFGRDVNKPSHG